MTALGSTQIMLRTKTANVNTQALVTTNLARPMLLSWHDLIRLKIINNHFPNPTALPVESSTRSEILERYPKVFKDTLDSELMLSEEVHLFLIPNATPYRLSAARQILLRFREPAEAFVKKLMEKGDHPVP